MQTTLTERIQHAAWPAAIGSLHNKGFALLPNILSHEECGALAAGYYKELLYRKTISMQRYGFGLGEYKYYGYPLPIMLQTIRQTVYPFLAPVANTWMKVLAMPQAYPDSFTAFQQVCWAHNQTQPTVLILQYDVGGYNTLHQDLYGGIFFPIQLVLFLNKPGVDYTGGEFVLTQQVPRAQSKATVLAPGKGDMLLFTTNFRPVKGAKGYYRANIKHGVSEVHTGQRNTVGIIFHDGLV
jgi:uncharacterized protein